MVNIILKIIVIVAVLAVVIIGGLTLYMGPGAVYVQPDQTFSDVKIQPSEALKIATPHLAKYGTYNWQEGPPLKTHIVRGSTNFFSDWYYVKRTNYPAKASRYYMHGAVKVHPQTGDVEYSPEIASRRSKED